MAKQKSKTNIEPNKYLIYKDIKPESKFSVLVAMVKMGLLLLGIAGIAMDFFREKGFISINCRW